MAMAVDLELKKAFADLSLQVTATRDKVRQFKHDIDTTTMATSRLKIMNKTITSIGPDRRTWEGIGRIFVLRPTDELAAKIGAQIVENEKKIKNYESNKQITEARLKESEDNIREMIAAKKLAVK